MLKEKILFLWEDGDKDIITMFSLFFQQHGFLTDNVESFDECLAFCKTTPPSILITCRFPYKPDTTLDLIQRIRSNSSIPYVPIIVGYANLAFKEEAYQEIFQAGANACFGHPFNITDVLELVQALVRNPHATNLVDRQSEYFNRKK